MTSIYHKEFTREKFHEQVRPGDIILWNQDWSETPCIFLGYQKCNYQGWQCPGCKGKIKVQTPKGEDKVLCATSSDCVSFTWVLQHKLPDELFEI